MRPRFARCSAVELPVLSDFCSNFADPGIYINDPGKTGKRKGDEITMPRGKRKTCTEKLCEVREMIEALETQLKDLKAKEKELLKERREEDLKHIADILEERNLTPDELAGILDQMSPAERVRLVSHVDPDEQAEWQAV